MINPQRSTNAPLWSNLPAYTPSHATDLVYGTSHEAGIVAVEQTGEAEVTVFRRIASHVRPEKREFQPWFITSQPDRFSDHHDVSVHEMRGQHPLRFRIDCASWKTWRLCGQQELRRTGDVIGPRSMASQYLMWSGITLFNDMVYGDLKRLQLDIETRTLDPSHDDAGVFMIALRSGEWEDVLLLESTEGALLEKLSSQIQTLDPDVIEGHNIVGFDIPYLVTRARKLGVPLCFGRNRSSPRELDRANGRDTVHIFGRHVVDTLPQVQRFDVAGDLTQYGLKEVVRDLGLERPDRVFVDRTKITELWDAGDRETLRAYALDDVRDVDVLSRLIMPNAFYQTQMLPTTYQGVTLAGAGRNINDLMMRAYLHADYSIPKPAPSSPFPGGYVDVVRTGPFQHVVKCDVESLYPSIMIRADLAPQSDVLGAFPVLLRELTTRRLDAKRNSRSGPADERAMWYGLQGGFKILINSFYGYLGFGRGAFNDYPAARWVTLEGQRIIKHVLTSLERGGAQPIEVDTDGVYFVPPQTVTSEDDERAFIASISRELGDGINLAHDGRFAAMLSLKQKTYALLDYDGRMHMTGSAMRSRALEPVFRSFLTDAARYLAMSDTNGAKETYFQLASRIIAHEVPIEDLSQTTRIRSNRLGTRTRLSSLLEANPERWRDGDRLRVYERADGSLAFADDFEDDENVEVLLKRLHDTVERFQPAFDAAVFDATFPRITPRSDLAALRELEPVQQLGLF